MASIKAFKAYRYTKLAGDINTLVYPMSEQLSSELLNQLQLNPNSAIHFSRSKGKPSKPLPELVKDWIQHKIIEKDPMDTIYVWYQYYSDEVTPGKIAVRKGFTCQIKLEEWEDRIILPHEQVIPKSVNNKQDFLADTGLSFAPIQALYEEKSDRLDRIMDEAIKAPMYDFTDAQQIRNVLAPIHDYKLIKLFADSLKEKQIILADGHHRYHAALEYSHAMDKKYGSQPDAPWHYLNIYLSNTEDPGLKILPFHREFTYEEEDLPHEVIEKAEEDFNILPVKTLHEIPRILARSKTACCIVTSKSAWILELKVKLENSTYQRMSSTYIGLIQDILVDKNLKKKVTNLKSINYSSNFTNTLNAVVAEKRTKLALILQPTAIEEVKRVCYSGGIMPEKSTFFYPKLMAGLLFSRIESDQQT
jgi:uncharacterized protein (DUF1015 family)